MNLKLLLACWALLMSACGWHLRGSGTLDTDIGSVFVDSEETYGGLTTELKRVLRAYQVSVANSASDAVYTVYLSDEEQDRRAISVGNDALVTEYELTSAIDLAISRGTEPLLEKTRIEVSRTYTFDRNAMVAKSQEEQLLMNEMQVAIIEQILRRLRFLARSHSESAAPEATGKSENGNSQP